jgi:alginate O-acetyltransferase complex protein AlgI
MSAPPLHPITLDRHDLYGILKWVLVFSLGYGLLSLGYAFLLPDYDWELPGRLIGLSALLWYATRRNHYPLVLGLCGFLYLAHDYPVYAAYFLVTSAACYSALHYGGRRAAWLFWGILVFSLILLPKSLHTFFHTEPARYNWVVQAASTGLFLRYAYYFYEWQRGLWPRPPFLHHLTYIAFIPQVYANLNFSPSTQWTQSPPASGFADSARNGFNLLGLAFLKITVYHTLARFGPSSPGESMASAWAFVLVSYLKWFCWLSSHYDLSITFCRFLGADIPPNFRFPLLAASPIEHWRRWNIFNRALLLKFFYFPFGGNRHHPYRNVFIVFTASALLLHTGWFGSIYLTADLGHALHWLVYALANAVLIVGNMEWRRRRGVDPHHLPRGPRWFIGWIATQATIAWLHILILWQEHNHFPGDTLFSWQDRLRLLRQGLGF